MKTIQDYDCKNQKVLIRVDFNVPQNQNLEVTDISRIEAAKETILHVVNQGGKAILMSHLGRPKGEKIEKYSLKNIVSSVEKVIGKSVHFCNDSVGNEVEQFIDNKQFGEIILLENLRFYKEEESGNEIFAKQLAQLADIYVNDAFGTAHRAHASTAVIAKFVEKKCFGFLMAKELQAIDKVLKSGEKPVTAILGGSKVSSKITIIENILDAVDNMIIGGGMAYTFAKALGGTIGNSLVEEDKIQLALDILQQAKDKNVEVFLPIDTVIADDFNNNANIKTCLTKEIPEGWMGLDIGAQTQKIFDKVLSESKTILWNGPLGVFEMENFKKGTVALGNSIEKATQNGAFSLVGGGDSVAFVKQNGYDTKVSYVSTGGGAMLESLEGKQLPGVAAILK